MILGFWFFCFYRNSQDEPSDNTDSPFITASMDATLCRDGSLRPWVELQHTEERRWEREIVMYAYLRNNK